MTTDDLAARRALLDDLRAARQSILDALAGLPLDRFDEVFLGDWSALDVLAHLVGWDFTNLKAAQDILAGQLPGFYAYHDHDWRTYSARLVTVYRRADPAAMLDSAAASHDRLLAYLETVPAPDLSKDTGVRYKGVKVTLRRLLQTEIDDERVHAEQIRAFAGREKP